MKVNYELKKDPDLQLNKMPGSLTNFGKVVVWILIGLLVLIGFFFIIYGFAPR